MKPLNEMTAEEQVAFISKHEIASHEEARTWPVTRLKVAVEFIKSEIAKYKTMGRCQS